MYLLFPTVTPLRSECAGTSSLGVGTWIPGSVQEPVFYRVEGRRDQVLRSPAVTLAQVTTAQRTVHHSGLGGTLGLFPVTAKDSFLFCYIRSNISLVPSVSQLGLKTLRIGWT